MPNAPTSTVHHERPVPPVPANPKPHNMANVQRPSQEAICNEEPSTCTTAVAFTQHTLTPTLVFLADSPPHSNLKLKSRLCWKLPDLRECSERHAYHNVNDRPQPSEMKHSPLPGQHPCYPYQDTCSQVS